MPKRRFVTPFVLPVAAFALTILAGAFLLWLGISQKGDPTNFVDALFIATSSVCVTGLASVDPSTVFNRTGHTVMLVLIQLGGLGIITYSTLILHMLGKRVSLGDRLAVGQALLNDTSFHLGKFLQRIVLIILCIEAAGAVWLYMAEPDRIGLFHACFLAVSAFCNAGFALWPDNLIQWQNDWSINGAIMSLIFWGGIGFFVIDELLRVGGLRVRGLFQKRPAGYFALPRPKPRLSYHTKLVLITSLSLVFGGAGLLFAAEFFNPAWKDLPAGDLILPALFQSVSARTAGFSSVNLGLFTDISLLSLVLLMFIGGSPGSCAGGIKTTTFRVLFGYFKAQLRGHRQVLVAGKAMEERVLNKAMLLFFFSTLTVFVAVFLLSFTENGAANHGQAPVQLLDIFFEVVSAFGTVGLSVNLTPSLSAAGKVIICLVMFIGRLGPIWLITTLQQFQSEPPYRLPETDVAIG